MKCYRQSLLQWYCPVSGAVIPGGSNWTSLAHGKHLDILRRLDEARRLMLFFYLRGYQRLRVILSAMQAD